MVAPTEESTRLKQDRFLAAYKGCGTIRGAARVSEISFSTHYRWMTGDPTYPERFEMAHKEACDALEAEAWRRAVEGGDELIYFQGACIGSRKKYSDQLLIKLLEANLPTKFGNKIEATHFGTATGVQIYLPERQQSRP